MSTTSTISPIPPERSLEQRREALRRANQVRKDRAELKRELKKRGALAPDGKRWADPVVPLLLEPPQFIETAKVYDLLIAIPKVGRVKASKMLNATRVSPTKTIGGMTARQRQELLDLLNGGTRR